MKVTILVATLSFALLTVAEPPVPNSYLPPTNTLQAPQNSYLPAGFQQTNSRRPSNFNAASAPNQQYGAPSQQYGTPAQQYNAPSQQYGAPNQQYGAPAQQNQITGAVFKNQQQQQPQRQQQSNPSTQYGVPAGSTGGLEYSEPAKYSFEYKVEDAQSGNDFGHMESRDGDRTTGRYYVLLPDGRKQVVTYEADQNGYRPTITYEDAPNNGGYNGGNNGYPSNNNGYSSQNDNQFNGY